jgi:hypothetical protein
MRLEELCLIDPAQDGPCWAWTGPGFPPEEAEQIRQKYAREMLTLQKRFCLSGDEVHALRAQTLATLHHAPLPPWTEAVAGRLAWSALLGAQVVTRGRRHREMHWARYMAVLDHLRWQREAGKKRNVRQAYRDAAKSLHGRLGGGNWKSVGRSYERLNKDARHNKLGRYILGPVDRRYRDDIYRAIHKATPPAPPRA